MKTKQQNPGKPGMPDVKPSLPHGLTWIVGAVFLGILLATRTVPAGAATETKMERQMENGLNHMKAEGDVETAWNRLLSILETMKAPVFSKVDHKANAVFVGLDMKEARVVSFGNPAVGTFLMQQNPEAALDLPLKILVWESPEGTMLTWSDPAWIAQRHGIDSDNETVKKMGRMLETIAAKVADPH